MHRKTMVRRLCVPRRMARHSSSMTEMPATTIVIAIKAFWSAAPGPGRCTPKDSRLLNQIRGYLKMSKAQFDSKYLICILFVLAILPLQVLAQEDPHAHHQMTGWVPREILERPTSLREGIGKVHVAVTTSSADAQAFSDQGFAYLHSYVWIEAARSFNQALRYDSNLAMAYLGLSYAYSGIEDDESARAMLAKAQSLATKTSEQERRRIEIRARQLQAIADP